MTETVAIPRWVIPHQLVKFIPTGEVMEVMTIDAERGTLETRGAQGNATAHWPLDKFAPVTLEDKILYALDCQRIKEIKSILPHGKEERQFRIQFRGHISPDAIAKLSKMVPDTFDDAVLDGDGYIITVKLSWLLLTELTDPVTPARLALAEATAEQAVAAAKAALTENGEKGEDGELTETARLIKELRERNARLEAENQQMKDEKEALENTVETLRDNVASLCDDLNAHDLRAADALEVATSPATTCKESRIARNVSEVDFDKAVNAGWEPLHIQFTEFDKLCVVFVRTIPAAPAPLPMRAAAQAVAPVPAIPTITLNKGTPPIRYEDIARDRVQLQEKLTDPTMTDYEFSLAVERTRLPRAERDALIRQFRNLRTGARLQAQFEQLAAQPPVRRPFRAIASEVSS